MEINQDHNHNITYDHWADVEQPTEQTVRVKSQNYQLKTEKPKNLKKYSKKDDTLKTEKVGKGSFSKATRGLTKE